MSTTTNTDPVAAVQEPWFRGHRTATVVVIGVLFAGILLIRLLMRPVADASSMLYVLPVALAALAFGWRAGVLGAVTGIGLIAVWAVITSSSLSPVGWISRAVPLLLLGYLLGDASDRLRRAEEDRSQAEAAALLYRQAIEINDSVVQGMAAARWALESGRAEAGLTILDTTMEQAQELVSELIRQAGLGVPAPTPTEEPPSARI